MTRTALAAALLLGVSGAAAQEGEPSSPETRLDALFETLADPEATDPQGTLRDIAEIWSMSGSDSMDLLLRRGREAMEAEEFDKAAEHLRALTRLDPDFAEGWNALATVDFLREQYWAAMESIQRALALEPRHFGAMSGLGIVLERIGDEAGALQVFREAVRVNPHLDQAHEAIRRLAPKVEGRDI